MHLLTGILKESTTLMTSATGLIAFGAACYGARRELSPKELPSLLAMTGFVFFAQMVNCATGLGFSGHLLGAALLAVLFGPFSAMLAMGVVLSAQVAFLGDGSVSTLGANFINMGVIAPWVGYGVFRMLQGRRAAQLDAGQRVALGVAGWASTLFAAAGASCMTGGDLGEMLFVHSVIGGIEAVLSVGVFAICVRGLEARERASRSLTLKPIVAVCLLALCLVPLGSKQPDGLQHVLGASSVDAG